MFFRLLLLGAVLALTRCQERSPPSPGAYYWQTDYAWSAADRDLALNVGFTGLYLRLFDVDWDEAAGRALPRAPVRLPDTLRHLDGLALTPVVFIVNRVFARTADPAALAERVGEGIRALSAAHPALREAAAWQIDADWTPTTRAAYFSFLTALRRAYPEVRLSVTVRLHQYRDRAANGIPPVDRGLLMCYNLGPVGEVATPNAIFDLSLLRSYLRAPPYPLPLDAALPLFEWGAAFRDGRFLGLTPPPPALGLTDSLANRYLVQRDTVVGKLLLRAGDEVRYDRPVALPAAVDLLRNHAEIGDLLFYDWRPDRLRSYRAAQLIDRFYAPHP